jgi:23S rRNA U2552 (ribose-2'-O)-methylase RlmE/FtsJ
MQVIQTNQNVFADLSNFIQRKTFVMVISDQTKQAITKEFKDHALVLSIWTCVLKVINQLDNKL